MKHAYLFFNHFYPDFLNLFIACQKYISKGNIGFLLVFNIKKALFFVLHLLNIFETVKVAIKGMEQETAAQSDISEEITSIEKCQSMSRTDSSGGFECNICLDLVQDPVVTFCGHLYCWPCIYRWINSHGENEDHQQPQCPFCKSEVSQKTLIPLYGRSQTSESLKTEANFHIPQRPKSATTSHLYPIRPPRFIQPSEFDHRMPSLMFGETHLVHPMIGMFGEMVYARVFGNSETTLNAYSNSYYLPDSNNPRLRRHMIQTDRSLGRVCFFLFCCVIFCLLLF